MTCGQPHLGKGGGQSMPQRMVNQMPHYDKRPVKDKRPKPKYLMRSKKEIRWL